MQILAIVVSLAVAAVGIALFVQAIRSMVATIRMVMNSSERRNNERLRNADSSSLIGESDVRRRRVG